MTVDRALIAAAVEASLAAFLDEQRTALRAADETLAGFADHLGDLTTGGKRIRPAFCYAGWIGAGADPGLAPDAAITPLARAAASLELLQVSALIHDDLIDASETRRGRPAAHVRFADVHTRAGYLGEPSTFGANAAVLLGDLAQAWADELLRTSGLPTDRVLDALRTFDIMRTEVITGQYADVLAEADPGTTPERAMLVLRFKSGRYSVMRPLELGGRLAGAGGALLAAYRRIGDPTGEAFQLRDDVLGVFGDPAVTGKPAGDDIRQGKRTVLVTLALRDAAPSARAVLLEALGDAALTVETTDRVRQVLIDTGALSAVEQLIDERVNAAEDALAGAPVTDDGRALLGEMITASAHRAV